jgi:chromate reductase
MQILALSGSLRAASRNTALLGAGALLAPPGLTLSLFDGLAALRAGVWLLTEPVCLG